MGKAIIYQLLPRLWGNPCTHPVKNGTLEQNGTGKFSGIDTETLAYLKGLGVSYVWYTGVLRHATCAVSQGCTPSHPEWVKGQAGSPFAITDYFDVNPYLAERPADRMTEFEDLVRRTHEAGMKVLLDFIPNHLARDYGRFSPQPFREGRDAAGHCLFGADDDPAVHWSERNDFFYYPGQALRLPEAALARGGTDTQTYREIPAKASGNSYSPSPSENDWYDTVKLNYGDRHGATWDKMSEVLEFWLSKGVDGFRCDMVELVPDGFFKWLIARTKARHPAVIFIAEVYQKALYGKYLRDTGFDFLYDKSGLYDALRAIVGKNTNDSGVPVEQWQSARLISWNWQQLGDLQPRMLNFLENHDEQRLASDYFAGTAEAGFAPLYVSLLFNTAPFLLYCGQEVGERGMDEEGFSGRDGRTSIFDWWSPASLRRLYGEIHGGGARLQAGERSLLQRYRSLLHFAVTDPAIREGTTYDLCYCNLSSDGFNKDRHFAFLRDYEDETLLVAANFSAVTARMELMIPEHAFRWLEMPETERLNHRTPVRVEIPPKDGVVLRLCPAAR